MILYMIRHGESLANINKTTSKIEMDFNNNLSNSGIEQIHFLSNQSIFNNIDCVFSSPMYRTIESASIFIRNLNSDPFFLIDDRLREIDYGIYTDDRENVAMSTISDMQKHGDYEIRFGGGENKREIVTRFFDFVIDLYLKFPKKHVAVFSHGRAISIFEAEFNKVCNILSQHKHTSNASVKEFHIDANIIKKLKEYLNLLNSEEYKKRISLLNNLNISNKTKDSLLLAANSVADIDTNYETLFNFISGITDSKIKKVKTIGEKINKKTDVTIITTTKNSELLIGLFLVHYKNIGVDNFIIIDNNSSDKTIEVATNTSIKLNLNTEIWNTPEIFNPIKAMGWKQKILEHYGFNRWYINLDIDEFLLIEQNNIPSLIKKLQNNNLNNLGGILIEQYPKKSFKEIDLEPEIDIIKTYRYYDSNDYYFMPNEKFNKRIFGGMRTRLFGITPSLQKIPLFLFSPGLILINPHFFYPYSFNSKTQYTLPILHYKFLPGDEKKFISYIKNKVHYNNSSEYKAYYDKMKQNNLIFFNQCCSKKRKNNARTLSDLNIKIKSILRRSNG